MKLFQTPLRLLRDSSDLMRLRGSPAGDQHPAAHRRDGASSRPLPGRKRAVLSGCRIPPRFGSLIRAGNLYLSAHDVVALAIENNIDVEIQRYGPLLAEQILKRAQAGGALRSVGLGVATGPQSVSLTGVSVNTFRRRGPQRGQRRRLRRRHCHPVGSPIPRSIPLSSASPVSDIPLFRRATWCSPTPPSWSTPPALTRPSTCRTSNSGLHGATHLPEYTRRA